MLLRKIEILLKNKTELALFFFVSLLITFPWFLKPGYLFFTDFVFGPQVDLSISSNLLFVNLFLAALSSVFGGPLAEKIFLFLILFFTQLSGHHLSSLYTKEKIVKSIVGVFLVVNPFFYDRFMYGQFGVILGLTFLIYSFYFLNKVLSEKTFKNLAISGTFFGFSILSSPHYLFIGGFFMFLFYVFNYKKYKIKDILLFLSFTFLITAFWLFMQFFRGGSSLTFTEGISDADLAIFQTAGESLKEKILNVFLMLGFWGSKQHRYFDLQGVSFWWRGFCVLIPVLIFGGYNLLKENKKFFYFLLSIVFGAAIFSIASSEPYLKKLLYETIPFYKSLREPQKWASLIVLVYAIVLTFSLEKILKLKNNLILIFLTGLSILSLTPFIFFGTYGQIKSQEYPDSWKRVNQLIVESDKCQHETLMLPWHLYMSFSFNENKVTAHPAKSFFECKTINGTNMEWGGIYDNSNNLDGNIYGSFVVSKGKNIPLKMRYIILTKDVDYKEYLWLNDLKYLKIIEENKDLIIYEKI